MPLFPPGPPVTVLINGSPLEGYLPAYLSGGRVFVPIDPLLVRLADRIWFEDDTLVVERGTHRVRVPLGRVSPNQRRAAYVVAAPVLRGLGATLSFEPQTRTLRVSLVPRDAVATPTPFNAAIPSAPHSTVFTPVPAQTPRPVWTGSPLPRRTPLFVPTPNPE